MLSRVAFPSNGRARSTSTSYVEGEHADGGRDISDLEFTVSCGGHHAKNCADCPRGNGAAWCHGDCEWCHSHSSCVPLGACSAVPILDFLKRRSHSENVSCGRHYAPSCSKCPKVGSVDYGPSYCNGSCRWLIHESDGGNGAGECVDSLHFEKETGCSLLHKIEKIDEANLDINCDNIHELSIGGLLNRGNFKEVLLGRWHNSSRTYAIKVLGTGLRQEDRSLFIREASVMYELREKPNILSLRGFCNGIIVTDQAHGDLSNTMKKDIPAKQRLSYAYDVVKSVHQLHSMSGGPVVHGDLQPRQFLLAESGEVVLGDFDSVHYVGNDRTGSKCQSVLKHVNAYSSPEQKKSKAYDEKSDIYALGNVIWSILTGYDLNNEPIDDFVTKANITQLQALGYPYELVDLLNDCLATSPSLRPSSNVVLSTMGGIISAL